MHPSFRFHPLTLAALFAVSPCAWAQAAPADADKLTPTASTWRFSTETLRLPQSEDMSLLGGNLLFDMSEHLRLGVASYGAVRGERGGFITLGVAGEYQQRLAPSWLGHAGLYVGAGGGRGSNSLAGGGLMLRADAGLSYETAGYGNFGLGLSHVRFPSGVIRSTQPYLQYEYPFYSLLGKGWGSAPASNSVGLIIGPDASRQEFSVLARSYTVPRSVLRDDGQPQHGRMQLMGAQWLSYVNDRWYLQLEADGAMGGQSNGYMQIQVGGGYRLPLLAGTALKLHAATGPAGGGNVDTGGGLLFDAGLALQQQFSPHTALELSLGEVQAPSRSFKARSLGLQLTHLFGLPSVTTGSALPWRSLAAFDAEPLRVRAVTQSYFKADPEWRNSHVQSSVSNLGVQLDYFIAPNWFVTGQGLAAYAGGAGAYMTGQVGLGTHWPLTNRWFVEAEALVGAAGGGGLSVGGGLVGQANAGIGYQLSKALSLSATAGHISAARGPFKANVAGLALAYQFTAFAAK